MMTSSSGEKRADELRWAHRLPPARLVDRVDLLTYMATGLRVAHIGFGDVLSDETQMPDNTWTHAALSATARDLVGLDISETAVRRARSDGYNVHRVDCTKVDELRRLDLGVFDLVIAAEVIEHLDASGPFLEAMRELVSPTGSLIVTTPNAYRPQNIVLALGRREWIHPDHVALFSPRTLSVLLERNGWEIDELAMYLLWPRARTAHSRGSLSIATLRALTWLQRQFARRRIPYIADGICVIARPVRAAPSADSGAR